MAALYSVQYAGKTGTGVGAMYFGMRIPTKADSCSD